MFFYDTLAARHVTFGELSIALNTNYDLSKDNAAMESFFSSLKTERTARKIYRSRDETKADVFDYIERFYNVRRRRSTIGYMSPMEFERQAGLA